MVDINDQIVLSIADRMDASCLALQRRTNSFASQWSLFRDSFDDTTKSDIEKAILAASNDITHTIETQQASTLMREYVKSLRGGS